jgi:hypothetical protein
VRVSRFLLSLKAPWRVLLAAARREEGASLLLVLAFMIAFSITTSAIVVEVTSNERFAKRDDTYSETFHKAEAALAAGIDWVNSNDSDGIMSSPTRFPTSGWAPYTALDASEASQPGWYAEKVEGAWTVHSYAVDGDVERELEIKLQRGIDPETIDLQSWQGVYSNNPPGTCITISNNAGLVEHVYTRGDLCIGNNGFILDDPNTAGPNTTVYVGGRVILDNNSYIGTSSSPILKATIVGGCWYGGKSRICSNSSQSHVYSTQYSAGISSITKPAAELSWYENASPGPAHWCDPALGSPVPPAGFFDNNTTRDNSRGDINPFGSTAYTCKTLGGEISWDPATGTATVNGVVFFDGNLNITNNVIVRYQGRGTIYFNGTVYLSNNVQVCPKPLPTDPPTPDCDKSFDFDNALWVLVALNGGVTPPLGTYTFELNNNAIFQGAAYAVGGVYIANNCQIMGPVVADDFDLKNNATYYTPIGDDGLPDGAPVNAENVWSVQLRTWRQIK